MNIDKLLRHTEGLSSRQACLVKLRCISTAAAAAAGAPQSSAAATTTHRVVGNGNHPNGLQWQYDLPRTATDHEGTQHEHQ